MRKILGWACIFAWAGLCLRAGGAAADEKKTSASPKTSSKPGTKKSGVKTAPKRKGAPPSKAAGKTGKKTASSGKTAAKATSGGKAATPAAPGAKAPGKAGKKGAASKRGKQAPRVTWRNRQTAPAPERYKQIQDALAAKGFLDPADASGAWGQSSVDALKKFQAAQKIEATGKINSLSLIALGLGPKREAVVKVPEAPPEEGR